VSDTFKNIALVGGTALVGIIIAALWNTLSSGVEAEIGKNPAITELQQQINALVVVDEDFKQVHTNINMAIAVNNTGIAVNGVRVEDAVTGVNQLRGAILNP